MSQKQVNSGMLLSTVLLIAACSLTSNDDRSTQASAEADVEKLSAELDTLKQQSWQLQRTLMQQIATQQQMSTQVQAVKARAMALVPPIVSNSKLNDTVHNRNNDVINGPGTHAGENGVPRFVPVIARH